MGMGDVEHAEAHQRHSTRGQEGQHGADHLRLLSQEVNGGHDGTEDHRHPDLVPVGLHAR